MGVIPGLALAYYRLEDIVNGDKYIDESKSLGRTLSFCQVRKGIARYHKAKKINNLDVSIALLEDALKYLEASEKNNSKADGYAYKNSDDAIHYMQLTRGALKDFRTRRTYENKKL